MSKVWVLDKWYGGLSTGTKVGVSGSFAAGRGLDIYTDPDLLSVNRRTTLDSGATVTDLVKWQKKLGTSSFFYGNTGRLYNRTAAGVWALDRSVGASSGNGLEVFNSILYYSRDAFLGSRTAAGVFNDAVVALNNDADWHPLKSFLNVLAVGNGNTLSTLSTANVLTNAFSLPAGLKIKCLEVVGDYLAIGAWSGATITENDEGYLFFWDGVATTYNSYITVKESGVNALIYDDNQLIVFAGTKGNFYVATGSELIKLKRLPGIGTSYADVWPGAVTRWNGRTHFGVSGETGSATMIQGVYSWGSVEKNYPAVLNLEYPISTGTTTGTTLQIGSVGAMSPTELFIGWRDGASFGVDLVSTTTPFASATYESVVFDGGNPFQGKVFYKEKVTMAPLPTNTTVAVAYRTDRNTAYTTIGTITGDGAMTEFVFFEHIVANAIQFRLTLSVSAGTAAPQISSVSFEYDDTSDV